MKTLTVLCWLGLAITARSATVVISVTGTVSETDASRFFSPAPVKPGDAWSVRMEYLHPTPPDGGGIGVVGFTDLTGSMVFSVNGLFWNGTGVGANVVLFENHRISFLSGQPVPAPLATGTGAESSTTILQFTGGGAIASDLSSMPDSFADWNLPASATFSLSIGNRYGTSGDGWFIRSDNYDTISIEVVPEPSVALLAGIFSVSSAGRRRRVRPPLSSLP